MMKYTLEYRDALVEIEADTELEAMQKGDAQRTGILGIYPMPKPTMDEVQNNARTDKIGATCCNCEQYPFFYPDTEGRRQGHIYSRLGMKEFGISYMCEYCFDIITREPEDEDAERLD